MAVNLKEIERMEELLRVARLKGKSIEVSTEPLGTPHIKAPKIEIERREGKRLTGVLTITPMELSGSIMSDGVCYARKLGIEQRVMGCTSQRRTVEFADPVRVGQDGVYMRVPRGRNRFESIKWQAFDPWRVFSGAQKDIKALKALRVGLG